MDLKRRTKKEERSKKRSKNWILLATAFTAVACSSRPAPPALPAPTSLDEFRSAVVKVLDETGIPGAGIALVRQSGIEWAGGVGFADRDTKTPVTADTHFRAGSISKTFVAMALVQLSEDGDIHLDTPVAELAPQIRIENPWETTEPIRVIHLLEHTSGFDDMHFNEMYNVADAPDISLEDVLKINPRSRRARWRPGTRMSYSNPGYTVAAYVLEQVTGQKYEDIIQKKIFEPIGMKTSSFRLTEADKNSLAKGYDDRVGPPVPLSQIYLRPSGNLHTSAAELGAFVHVLLNWGEMPGKLVVDPEYLSNMEHPRTTLAARAGLLNGYGSAIASLQSGTFPLLGHGGGIEGFRSQYAYSPSRDVGFVVLLNGTFSNAAMDRISTLGMQYLKADVEPPAKPELTSQPAFLDHYVGYYHDASPRLQARGCLSWLFGGQTIKSEARQLYFDPVFGSEERLIPVGEGLFRRDQDDEATRVFATDEDGRMILTGPFYAERVDRWRVEVVRVPVLVSFVILMTPLAFAIVWVIHARRAQPRGFWGLKSALLLAPVAILGIALSIRLVPDRELGRLNLWTETIWVGTVLLPIAAGLASIATLVAWARGAGPWLRAYSLVVSCSAIVVSAYLSSWGMVGFKPWDY
jgi:CubicO group peptidase (beta-lactamase class C family)